MDSENLKIWDDIFSSRAWGKYPEPPVIRFIARNFFKYEDRSPFRVLELGPGPGANLWFMAREGLTVYGIEGSLSATEQAKKRLDQNGLNSRIGAIISGDYSDIPFEDDYFDAIIDVESLSCNPYKKSAEILNNCFKKLKQGGHFFSQTFADGCWGMEVDKQESEHRCLYPDEGPLHGIGLVRYTTRDDIDLLYGGKGRRVENVELYQRTLSGSRSIREYVVESVKL